MHLLKDEARRGGNPGRALENYVVGPDGSENAPAHLRRQVAWVARRYALDHQHARLIAELAFSSLGRAG